MDDLAERLRALQQGIAGGPAESLGYVRMVVKHFPDVVEKLEAWIAQMDVIHADERFKSVWVMAQVHGSEYSGPTYEAELDAACAALTALNEALPHEAAKAAPPSGEGGT